ncbi:MAG: GldG family protein, partial [Planctomycetes bacterium]|nr:GldG family protein [Planctomycetota bacterium]
MGLGIKKQGRKPSAVWVGVFLVAANLFALNLLADRHSRRWDLTEDQAHTLSAETQRILKSLDDLVTVRCFITRDLPAGAGEYLEQLEDLLEEMAMASNNRLQIVYLDPSADGDSRREAEQYKIPERTFQQASSDSLAFVKACM